jgi:hypothetical protein
MKTCFLDSCAKYLIKGSLLSIAPTKRARHRNLWRVLWTIALTCGHIQYDHLRDSHIGLLIGRRENRTTKSPACCECCCGSGEASAGAMWIQEDPRARVFADRRKIVFQEVLGRVSQATTRLVSWQCPRYVSPELRSLFLLRLLASLWSQLQLNPDMSNGARISRSEYPSFSVG